MFGQIFSNRVIRKIITGFGSLFTNTTLVRFNRDGSEQERLVVPIAFAEKEKYIQVLEGDPLADKNISITLPQMSFDLKGIKYDPTRKLQTTEMNYAKSTSTGEILTQYVPVPYNFDFSLYIYVRNVEDGTQIIEQILPFFTPDYTMRITLVPSMGITKDIPIILNDTEYEVDNTGPHDGLDTRTVIWTLNFTVKGYLFGPVNNGHIIKEAITNLFDWVNTDGKNLYLVLQPGTLGTFKPGELLTQNNLRTPNATATILNWSPTTNRLYVDNVEGIFSTNSLIVGVVSGATATLINYEITPIPIETIIIRPDTSAYMGEDFFLGDSDLGERFTANTGDTYKYQVDKIFYA